MNELALFAGAGGGILGGHLLGWRTVCAVEWEAYPASVLCARQNDGLLPPFPIWDDVQTFDGNPWRGIVDVVSGGFPCQDISSAGKGAGIDGERSGMWGQMARIIGEVRPQYAFIENSPMLTTRGLERVLADLAKMGFDAEWGVLSAADVGANHIRERIWICAKQREFFSHSEHDRIRRGEQQPQSLEEKNGTMAYSRCELRSERDSAELDSKTQIRSSSAIHNKSSGEGQLCNSNSKDVERQWKESIGIEQKLGNFGSSSWWEIEPNMGRVADGVAARMDRLKAIGNGQVPLCAATAWKLLIERLKNGRN
jgi:DNA (cytosine-5)-methyltransferase 1